MPPSDFHPTSAVLAEAAWVHRLARRLVADPGRAEDAAQEALVAALARPPAARVPLRRWLAALARNSLRRARRGETRRGARERARPGAGASEEPGPAEVAAQLELHQALIEAVRELDEPYRTTVFLRFLEELAPAEIARRSGVPVKTVHTRIERALEALRSKLDRRHGSRNAWAAFLLPAARLSWTGPGAGLAAPPLLAMSTTLKWTGATALLGLAGFLLFRSVTEDRGPRAAASATPDAAQELAAPLAADEESVEPATRRSEVESAQPERTGSPTPTDAPAEAAATYVGRVIDVELRPVAGLTVALEPPADDASGERAPPRLTATSDASGRFELPVSEIGGRLVARGRGYATLVAPGVVILPPEPPTIVVAPAASYAGEVVDPEGAPLEGVALAVQVPAHLLVERLQMSPAVHGVPLARGTTDREGRFAFEDVAAVEGNWLEVEASGFRPASLELPAASTADLRIALTPLVASETTIRGLALFEDGTPAEGARVGVADTETRMTRALADGSFALELGSGAGHVLCAVAAGHLPASVDLSTVPAGGRDSIRLVLGGEPQEIRGRVLDRDGKPVSGAQVWTFDGESFGLVPTRFGDVDFWIDSTVEELMAGEERSDGRSARTDDAGRFVLRGLLDRPYDVHTMHPVTLEVASRAGVLPGEVTLLFDGSEPARVVAGTVTSLGGTPLTGALLRVNRYFDGRDGTLRMRSAPMDFHAVTDEHGRFRFESLCIDGTELLLNGEIVPTAQARRLADEPDLEHVSFRVPAVCHVRVVLEREPELADGFSLEDEGGRSVGVTLFMDTVTIGTTVVQLEQGLSGLVQTDESARTLVLWKNGEVLRRVPIELVPGEVNELRP